MSDIKLFNVSNGSAQELQGTSIAIEKTLQILIENHLEIFLGVHFRATEYITCKKYGSRIDTLGIDENGSPVIIEYKRALNENVMNQGLFYLDWLMDVNWIALCRSFICRKTNVLLTQTLVAGEQGGLSL
jgi:RecB family endonuclease NucS